MSSTRTESKETTQTSTKHITTTLSNHSETKSSEEKSSSWIVFETENFTAIQLYSHAQLKHEPTKILVLDVDETLINFDESVKAEKLVFINKEKLLQKIKYAREKKVLLVIGTSREYDLISDSHFLSINSIIKELGIENFAYIFYTNGKFKSDILVFLCYAFYKADEQKCNLICLLDDNDYYLEECAFDFPAIKADKNDKKATYLDHLQDFIDDKPIPLIIPDLPFEPDFQNKMLEYKSSEIRL